MSDTATRPWPIFASLARYDRAWLRGDLIAGLTVWAVLVPEALAYASIAGVSPVVGLYAAVVELVDVDALRGFYRLYTERLGTIYGAAARPDFIAATAAMLGVLIFDTLPGLVIGVIVSLLLLVYRTSKPHVAELGLVGGTSNQFGDVERHPENVVDPAVPVLRVESGLYFANADSVRQEIRAHAARSGTMGVVLDAESIPSVDVTAVRMLDELAEELARNGQRLVIAHDLGQVADLLAEVAEPDLIVAPTIPAAIVAARRGAG